MTSQKFLTLCLGAATLGLAALGSIHVMKLRMEADAIGNRIVRIERSIGEVKKELVELKRQRDQSQDTLQLQQRIGDTMKPPTPDQVIWMHLPYTNPTVIVANSNKPSPRILVNEIAFRPTAGPGGNNSR